MISERDPLAKSAHEPGSKLDADKLRPLLVQKGFAKALRAVAAVATHGAKKYTDDGWKTVPNRLERYTNAMYRHLYAEHTGEFLDPQSDLAHAAHVAWNALARLEIIIEEHECRLEVFDAGIPPIKIDVSKAYHPSYTPLTRIT